VDVSPTAVEMARDQSKSFDIRYVVGDACTLDPDELGQFDLCIDGRFLHCITETEDRKRVLLNAHKMLSDGGHFIVMSMCSPIDRAGFHSLDGGPIVRQNIVYTPVPDAGAFDGAIFFRESSWLPTRYIAHWSKLLREFKSVGFTIALLRISSATKEEPTSSINVVLRKG
jgi:SAM-dependent methyltransferase